MQATKGPTCIDCDHAFEMSDAADTVVCSAHLEYRPAVHPANCEQFTPRRLLTESAVAEILKDDGG